MKLTIDRGKWLTGHALHSDTLMGDSMLEHPCGLQCCIGIYLSNLGVSSAEMRHMGMPSELLDVPLEAEWLLGGTGHSRVHNSKLAGDLQRVNDDNNISAVKREKQITQLFAKAGVTVEFTGHYREAWKTAEAYTPHS